MDYDAFAQLAQTKSYREITCEACRGKGRRMTLETSASEACSCGGSGRMWKLGHSVHQVTDKMLAARLGVMLGTSGSC